MIVIPVVMTLPMTVALVTVALVRVGVAVVLVRVSVWLVGVRVRVWVRHARSLSSSARLGGGRLVDRHVKLVVIHHVAYYAAPHVSQPKPEDRL